MPNIATAFKDEITRLCRKEMRKQLEPLRKAAEGYRKELVVLKRKLQEAERRGGTAPRATGRRRSAAVETVEASSPEKQTRFVPKGLKSMRERLGVSAAELAALLGVTGQSIYNWEQKKSTPRAAQLARLAELRKLGKKAIRAQLDAASPASQEEKPARGRKPRNAAAAAEEKPVRGRKPRNAAAPGEEKPARGRKPRAAKSAEKPARKPRKPREQQAAGVEQASAE